MKFVANDGKEFTSFEECSKYEEKCEADVTALEKELDEAQKEFYEVRDEYLKTVKKYEALLRKYYGEHPDRAEADFIKILSSLVKA